MAGQLVERDGVLFACEGALVAMDSAASEECEAVCPGCYDDTAFILFDNAKKSEVGGSWSFNGGTASFTWDAHAQCDGSGSGFEGHVYACVCVPTGHTLKIEIDGLRPYGVPAPGGGAGIMKHRVYVDGDSVATLAEETSTPEDCTLSNGTVNYTVEDAGLHCIHYECTSNGMWYNAGNVGFILEPDP